MSRALTLTDRVRALEAHAAQVDERQARTDEALRTLNERAAGHDTAGAILAKDLGDVSTAVFGPPADTSIQYRVTKMHEPDQDGGLPISAREGRAWMRAVRDLPWGAWLRLIVLIVVAAAAWNYKETLVAIRELSQRVEYVEEAAGTAAITADSAAVRALAADSLAQRMAEQLDTLGSQ